MTEEIEAITRKWGSSMGIVIPNEIVEKEHLKPNEKIRIVLKKEILAKDIWNLGPITLKKTAQEIKDEMRKGW